MTTPPVLSKVHTFAQDLERVRGSRGNHPTPPVAADTTQRTNGAATVPKATAAPAPAALGATTPLSVPTAPIKLTADTARDASYPATIITDKKRRTLNITEEVSSAVGDWWNEKVKSLTGSKKPTYSVPAVERRKGVVHAATTQTGRVATSDHREIVAKLKQETNRPIPEPDAPTFTPEKPTITPLVTPITPLAPKPTIGYGGGDETPDVPMVAVAPIVIDDIEPVAEVTPLPVVAPKPEPVTPASAIRVTEVVTRQPRIEPTIPVVLEETTEEPDEDSLYVEEEETLSPEEDFVPDSDTDDTVEEVVVPPEVVPAPPTPVSFPKINPVVPAPATPTSYQRENAFALLAEVPLPTLPTTSSSVKDTIATRMEQRSVAPAPAPARFAGLRHIAPYLAGGLFIIITIGGISYFMMTGTTPPPEQNFTTDFPTPLPSDEFTNQTYTPEAVTAQLDAPNKTSLYTAVKNTAGLGDGLFIVTPLAHDTAFPLGTREILSLMNRQLSPDFIGNITNIQLGMYRNEPVILLSISDENSARGGMFRWETTLSQDLSPWFGQSLRSTSSSSLTSFADSESAGRDVRILTDDIGTERITYGFINQSVLLITSNTTAFLNIADSYSGY